MTAVAAMSTLNVNDAETPTERQRPPVRVQKQVPAGCRLEAAPGNSRTQRGQEKT